MDTTDWQRRSALFDELVDVPHDLREAWLKNLVDPDAAHTPALQKMLVDLDESDFRIIDEPSIAGSYSRQFERQLNAALANESRLHSGAVAGAWRLIEKIGEGGMGAVWLAERNDGNFESLVAIKFLRYGMEKTEVVERFLRERRLLARLEHPGIARLIDAGNYNGEPYLVMDHIKGEPINAWAIKHASLVAERVSLVIKACRAVEHAHAQLIVHCDLKPSNVLVRSNGEPSLLDFGIAKLIDDLDNDSETALTRMTGRGFTLGYCAPEQITGHPTGVGADIFSMGAILFELLSGTLPFKAAGEGRAALEHAILHTEAQSLSSVLNKKNPSLTHARPIDSRNALGDLDAIVAKALRKNPADRYASFSTLISDLERWLNNQPVLARRGNWQYKTTLWLKRNRMLAATGAVALLAVSAGLSAALWQAARASDEARRADREKTVAVTQRDRAEIATAQAAAALAESEKAKGAAVKAGLLADLNAATAKQSEQIAITNAIRSRKAESIAAAASQSAKVEAAKAKAINQFMVALFEGADPEHVRGDKLTAREVLDAGADSIGEQFAGEPETAAELRKVLGTTYLALSQPTKAAPLLSDAAADAKNRYGTNSIEHARILYVLASAETKNDNYPTAEKHYKASLETIERVDGRANSAVLIGKISLAYALQKQGKYDESDKLLTSVRLTVSEKYGDKDWLFAEVETARAIAMGAQAKVKEQLDILTTIEPLAKNPPRGKRSDALMIRTNLIIALAQLGNYRESVSRLNALIPELTDHLGPEADQTIKTLSFSVQMLRLSGSYTECAAQSARLAEVRMRVSGANNPLTLDALSQAATCAQLTGDEAAAEKYMKLASSALPLIDRAPQRTVLRALLALQFVAFDRTDFRQILAMRERTHSVAKELNLAKGAPESQWIAVSDASNALRANDYLSAIRIIDGVIALPEHSKSISAHAFQSYLLAFQGDVARSRSHLALSRASLTARFTENHPVHRTLDYVEALIANPNDSAQALRALERSAGRTARLPLAPNWFGF